MVSVLMPVHDGGPFLTMAVNSILAQSFTDFEFVIVDDGSTDGSGELLARMARGDGRIVLVHNQVNEGIVHALNRGLDLCRGRYIARMDADDISHPDRLARQVDLLEREPGIAVLGSAVAYIDARGQELGVIRRCSPQGALLRANPMLHPTITLRADLLQTENLRYQERFRYAEDYFLWLQMSRLGKLAALDDVLVSYRVHDNATRMARLKGVLRAGMLVKLKAVTELGLRPSPLAVLRFGAECCLLAMPSALVRWLYLRLLKTNEHANTDSRK